MRSCSARRSCANKTVAHEVSTTRGSKGTWPAWSMRAKFWHGMRRCACRVVVHVARVVHVVRSVHGLLISVFARLVETSVRLMDRVLWRRGAWRRWLAALVAALAAVLASARNAAQRAVAPDSHLRLVRKRVARLAASGRTLLVAIGLVVLLVAIGLLALLVAIGLVALVAIGLALVAIGLARVVIGLVAGLAAVVDIGLARDGCPS